MAIKVVEDKNKVVVVKMGKGDIGVMGVTNAENNHQGVLFGTIKQKDVAAPITENDFQGGASVILEFSKPKSVDVVIAILESLKARMVADYTAKQLAKAKRKIEKYSK